MSNVVRTVPQARAASQPAAGAARTAVGVSLASIVAYYLGAWLPPEIMPDAKALTVVVFSSGLSALGKVLRARNNAVGELF